MREERRTNLALRALIDDMLQRVRDLNRDLIKTSDRVQAEQELESVMARVRRLAAETPVNTSSDPPEP